MKSRTRPLRLGSFEQLESRAMLAHGEMNFAELSFTAVSIGPENFGPMRFIDQGPGQYYSARDFQHEAPAFQPGGMEPRGEMRMENERSFEHRESSDSFYRDFDGGVSAVSAAPVFVIVPATPVIFVFNIPAPVASQPQYSAPVSSNNAGGNSLSYSSANNSSHSQSVGSPSANYVSSLLAPSAPQRSFSTPPKGFDSLPLATSLLFKRIDSDNSSTDEAETAPTDGDHDRATRDANERESVATIQPKDAAAATQTENENDSDLIEQSAEDPLARGKRRIARKPTSAPSEIAQLNSSLRSQRADRQQAPHADRWLQPAPTDVDILPVADDLIELLASESVSPTQTTAAPANSFDAHATLPIEATVGYFRATETAAEQNSPENAPPAAVAAAGK